MPSAVWKAFTKLPNEGQVKCNLCPTKYKYNEKDKSTGTLWSHLKDKHKKCYENLKKIEETDETEPSSSSQPPRVNFCQ